MYHLLFRIQFYCDLRIGETLALTRQDVDLDEKCISYVYPIECRVSF